MAAVVNFFYFVIITIIIDIDLGGHARRRFSLMVRNPVGHQVSLQIVCLICYPLYPVHLLFSKAAFSVRTIQIIH